MDFEDLFDAFDGSEKVEELDIQAQPQLKRKSVEGSNGGGAAVAVDGEAGQEEEKQGEGGGADGGARAGKKARVLQDEEVADADPFKVQPTITQNQELTTPDGRKVISFSAYPANYVAPPVEPLAKPAKEYPFTLDPFQQAAIGYIEKGESVLVAAHTSAGKTVTAEYAIAMSLQRRQRVIYTSPIKALSNQKYRDMAEEFGDVGLMTGDITINPTATCLIMTTEILRSMLYRGSEIMREVAWVVYDEVHYMRDKERGVVWEESIILLPHKVRFVFLSATIPNSQEFAGWIATIHHQPCHVVYTDYRPVPLQHYIFPSGGDGLYLVVDEKSTFRENNFQKAMAVLQSGPEDEIAAAGGGRGKKGQSAKNQQSDLSKIVKLIMERNYDPVIIFSFSKRECEAYALKMSKLDFNDESEKELVEQVFNNAIDSLAEEDKALPQVVSILPLLKRGVGIHHGGLLPILKEIIEILFQEGLLKCLFATETFSIGINMPAKTVVFTKCNKFDGKDFRWVTSGEYIQMSGRAGRRGKDDRGIVIMMMDSKMEPAVCKSILYGDPDKLYSSYHVSYNMLLNMLRVQGANPEFLVRSSFHQYQQEASVPTLEKEASEMEEEVKSIVVEDEDRVSEYFAVVEQIDSMKAKMRKWTTDPDVLLAFVSKGRLVKVKEGKDEWGWGAIVDYKAVDVARARAAAPVGGESLGDERGAVHVVDVLLRVRKGTGDTQQPKPMEPNATEFDTKVMSVILPCVEEVSAVRIHMGQDLRPNDARLAVARSIREVERRFSNGEMPMLDPRTDMKITDDAFYELLERVNVLHKRLQASPIHALTNRDELVATYARKNDMMERIKLLRKEAKSHQGLVMKEELKRMKRVLRRMGFINADNVLSIKGRVACEINTCDELVTTELMFNGVFNDLKPEQIVALMGCMCFEEKRKEGDGKVREDMEAPFSKLKETARAVGKIVQECKIPLDIEEYANSFNPDMIEVLYAWTLGAKFVDVIKLTDVFEGSVIRVIRRLDEMLRQLVAASMGIGDQQLKEKFEECSKRIRRDIVFAASLYC